MRPALPSHFHCALAVCHPKTRAYVRLLGPCFKTGRLRPFRQHPEHGCAASRHAPPPAPTLHAVPARSSTHPALGQAHTDPRCVASVSQAAKAAGCIAARRRLPARNPSPTRQTDVDPLSPQVHHPHLRPPHRHACAVTGPGPPDAWLITKKALLPSIGSLLTISRAFNSLFKVLFIFPSQYLFAIGLVPIFSFR